MKNLLLASFIVLAGCAKHDSMTLPEVNPPPTGNPIIVKATQNDLDGDVGLFRCEPLVEDGNYYSTNELSFSLSANTNRLLAKHTLYNSNTGAIGPGTSYSLACDDASICHTDLLMSDGASVRIEFSADRTSLIFQELQNDVIQSAQTCNR